VKFGPKLERRQMILGRLVEIGTELFAMTAACAKVMAVEKQNPGESGPRELADLFCPEAKLPIHPYFDGVAVTAGVAEGKVAANVWDHQFEGVEKGIMVDDGEGFKGKFGPPNASEERRRYET